MTPASARHPSQFPTIFTLAQPNGVIEVAEQCRLALLAFLNGVGVDGWSCAELAAWLSGPYETVTRMATEVARAKGGTAPSTPAAASQLDRDAVEQLMVLAHRECLNVLRSMIDPEQGTSFAFKLVTLELLMRCEDVQANCGWLPIAKSSMRLADRVQSLIAVDFLTRPEDYEAQLAICSRCGTVEFDAMARARGLCRQHSNNAHRPRRESDVDLLREAGLDHLAGATALPG
jgi:hypothetical protein